MNQYLLALRTLASLLRRTGQTHIALGRMTLGLVALLALGLSSPAAHAQDFNEAVLRSFDGDAGSDGACPYGGLVFVNSTLYGTTSGGYFHGNNGQYGGSGNINSGYGTLFTIHTSGAGFQTIHTFGSGTDGQYPYGRLLSVNGLLYGTTFQGGTHGDGTIFSIDPTTGTETILYNFGVTPTDGENPIAGLILVNNILYGTTTRGATSNNGTVFSIKTDGTGYQTLHRFTGTNGDGANPAAALIAANNILYGTTPFGGSSGAGTVFSINLSTNVETTLHPFTGTNGDGSTPLGDLLFANGKLYGTTYAGGSTSSSNPAGYGTVFTIHTDGNDYQTMYRFTTADGTAQFPPVGVNTDGALPISGLSLVNGLLYGTTTGGGTRGVGTLFFIDPATNTETTLCELQGANDPPGAMTPGGAPSGDLLNINGVLFTTCYAGAGGFGLGDGSVIALSTGVVAPAAHNDTYAPKYATAYVVKAPGVLGNDDNGGSNNVTADLVTHAAHGTLAFNSDGSFTYTPATGFVGTDSFTYQATNSGGKSSIATVTLNVFAAVPLARNDSYAPKYATLYAVKAPGVLGNDTNYDTGAMTATLVSTVSHGTLILNSDGSFTYTPAAGFVGADSFTYYATNPIGKSSTATVTLNVYAAAPVAKNDSYAPKYATAYAVKAPGVLANDYTGGSTTTAVLVTNPSHGSLTLGSDGSFTYTPATGYLGSDSFTYKDTNAIGTSGTATVTLTVQTSTPIAHSDSATLKHNTTLTIAAPGVLGNDYTGGSTPLTAAIVTQPAHGTVTLSTNGGYVYTPNAGYSGTDSFTYRVSNPVGTGTTAPVTLNVQ